MINIEFSGDGSLAQLKVVDLLDGKNIIYLGGGNEYPKPPNKIFRHIKDVINNIEAIITHESCHIAVFKTTNSIGDCASMDNIDDYPGWPICGPISLLDPKGENGGGSER